MGENKRNLGEFSSNLCQGLPKERCNETLNLTICQHKKD